MKKILTVIFLFNALALWAQPPGNDDCNGLIDLGVAPACNDVIYSNVEATASDIGFGNIPSCWNGGAAQNDVWFAFVASDTIFDYTITITGMADGGANALSNMQIAIYRGDCTFDGLAELACASAENGHASLQIGIDGLTPGATYFIRINDYSQTATPNWGTFKLCVDEKQPDHTIDQGGSTACSGNLFDSGGPDGDYGPLENNIFTICPTDAHNCINFTLDYYNIDYAEIFPAFDQIIFYDSDSVDPLAIIGIISSSDFFGGGGGVCYQVQATSGCMTVQFISDAFVELEGFAGSWECTTTECETIPPIEVEQDITEQAILDVISGPNAAIEITNINCNLSAYGLFEAGDNSDLGLGEGLILTSGNALLAQGPNNNDGAGLENFDPGDEDLDYLSHVFGDGTTSGDACIIEFDITPTTNKLQFEYIFGSEEYPEYVQDVYNDIFAFLISGPGIIGDPLMNNQLNIATLPNTNTPVQIKSVNNGSNWEYYRNNDNGLSVQYDGLTSDYLGVKKSLTAEAEVIPCQTYHLKLAIADRGDWAWDSGVFISEIRGGTPELAVQFNSGIDYLIEDCTDTPDNLLISLTSPQDIPVTYDIVVGGTAIQGVDYLLDLPDSISFEQGETEASFPITVLSDLDIEDTETIIISLVNDPGCGEVIFTSVEIELHDALNIAILSGQDTAFVCEGSTLALEVEGAAQYFWSPVNVIDPPTSATPAAMPETSMWVYVEGTLGPCTDIDSIYLQIIDPEIMVEALDPVQICQGDSVRLRVIDNVNHSNLSWSPVDGLNDPLSAEPLAKPLVTTDYIATVDVAGCIVSDTITIEVDVFEFPEIYPDTTICQNYSAQLAENIIPGPTPTQYAWTPSESLNNDTISGPLAFPDETTTYQLIATSPNEFCADTAEITITVLPADVEILNPDTVELCLGESAVINVQTSTGSAENLIWSPLDSLNPTTGLTVTANPEVSTWYTTTFSVGACTVFDSVYVRVDSLPVLDLAADPEKESYCEGDIVTLFSTTYEPIYYPDIEHKWLGGPGYETPDSLWNMVISTQDTFLYERETINHACVDTASILINVVKPPDIFIEPQFTDLCEGESVILTVMGEKLDELEELSWSPETGLSCIDCLSPTASPTSATHYTFEAEFHGCPVSASAVMNYTPLPVINLNPTANLCLGDDIDLGTNPENEVIYSWSTAGEPDFSNESFITVSPQTNTSYTLEATNDCGTVTGDVNVMVQGEVDIEVIGDTLVTPETEFTLTTVVSPEGEMGPYNWFKDFFQINGAIEDFYTDVINEAGESSTYIVSFTNGCFADSDTITVRAVSYEIPNAFTPNNDGMNDVFRVKDYDDVKLFQIFSRWGELVYESKNNQGWDGRYKGTYAPSDVYIYHIILNIDGNEKIEKGDVTLIR